MKYALLAILLLSVIGCDLLHNMPDEIETIIITVNITGTSQTHTIINYRDFGYVNLPFTCTQKIEKTEYTTIYIQAYSVNNISIELFKDGILTLSETNTFIEYHN